MKKLILIVFAVMAFSISYSQLAMTNPNGLTLDTVTNSTAKGCVLQVKGYQETVSLVVPIIKISGTIEGVIYWQGSNDGVKYGNIGIDSLTDATNTYTYDESPKRYLYYKALVAPSGTSSLSFKGTLYATKP